MPSRVFRRNTHPVTVEDENFGDNPVISQVQGRIQQGPLPQDNQGGRGREMFLTCGLHKRSTSCFSSVTSTESRNSQFRKFSISPLSSEKFYFPIEPFRVSRSGTASRFAS